MPQIYRFTADEENAAPAFWDAARRDKTCMPTFLEPLIRGSASSVITTCANHCDWALSWLGCQPGFADGPAYARRAVLQTTEDVYHAPEVQAWIALARAFQHKWVKKLDQLPADTAFESLDRLRAAIGGELSHIGALVHDSAGGWYEHASKTKRIRWGVSSTGGVLLRVTRPSLENWADPYSHEIVIEVQIRPPHHEDQEHVVHVDTARILAGEYGKRHVAVLHSALFALVGVPSAFGVSKKEAVVLVKMISAGAS